MKDMTVKELRNKAKEFGIVGRWDMTKQQLIDALNEATQKMNDESDYSDNDITFETDCIIKDEVKTNPEGTQNMTATTKDYIDNLKSGTLVAFKRDISKDLAMSGKYLGDDSQGKAIIESKKGTKYFIPKANIIWVKTGARWPKWVYSLFNIKEETDG